MNLTMMLLLHAYPGSALDVSGPASPRPQAPTPDGNAGEGVGEDENENETLPEKSPPVAPDTGAPDAPDAPDANPIDPRVFGSVH